MTLRHAFRWKTLFYEGLLPAVRRLGPVKQDALLSAIGRAWPFDRRRMIACLTMAKDALQADWDIDAAVAELAAARPRYLARDYLLEGQPLAAISSRFDVQGFEHLRQALDRGRGAILLGAHLGAHLAGIHWLHRHELPLRLLVQRPTHVSPFLRRRFDEPSTHPQSQLFLRRALTPEESVDRLMRARAALRDGMALYLNGDIPWPGPNSRPGRLLGQRRNFLGVWTDLAVLTKAPVILTFCSHAARGRYALRFESPWTVQSGSESMAVARYLERLEAEIAAAPAEAVAHLLWPCYSGSAVQTHSHPRHAASPRPKLGRLAAAMSIPKTPHV